jgi:hypothetical protein
VKGTQDHISGRILQGLKPDLECEDYVCVMCSRFLS